MSDDPTPTVKRTTRTRKTANVASVAPDISSAQAKSSVLEDVFNSLLSQLSEAKAEFLGMQRLIEETKQAWAREQREHGLQTAQQRQQEEIVIKREQETYEYETAKRRREQEDSFEQKRLAWERELQQKKDELAVEKKELETLRKQVAGFDEDSNKAVKEATGQLEKSLTASFVTEKKLFEQESKSEKELLGLKIANLTQENSRLAKEIAELKQSLDHTTTQLKDVAVKVIEAKNSPTRLSTPPFPGEE